MQLPDNIIERLNSIKSHTDPLSQAQMLTELKSEVHIANKDIAEVLGMKPSNISHYLRVTRLPEIVLDGYVSKQISFTHLILISRLKKPDEVINLYEEILQKGYTALQTERRIREILYLVDHFGNYVNKEKLSSFEQRIAKSLGTGSRAMIIQTRIKAKIIIEMSGNLEKTTDFIESFATRFRSKRNADDVNGEASAPTSEAPGSDIPGSSGAPVQDADVIPKIDSEDLTGDSLDLKGDEDVKKYRFDPDF